MTQFTGKFDYVGSFLRPPKLVAAQVAYKAGEIGKDRLKQVEDTVIAELIAKQKELGYPFLTDGEFRRETWHLDFIWGFGGVDHQPTSTGLPFHGETAYLDDTFLVGPLTYNPQHPFFDHLAYVQGFEEEGHRAKLTIPAPAQFLEQFIMPFAIEQTQKVYPDQEQLIQDLISVYQQFIAQAYEQGLRYLQLDDCSWGLLVDPRAQVFFDCDQEGLDKIKALFVEVNNQALAHKPADLVVNTHVCRGNFKSTFAASGGYDQVANYLFAKENVNAYFLEFDDQRSGSFQSLSALGPDKQVVLGLITSKHPELEDKDLIIKRIKEATQYVPLDRLSLSPQCGFASTKEGNALTEEEQWAKLKLVT